MMTFDEAFTKKRRIFAKAIKWDYNFATFRGFAFCKKIVEFLHNLFQKTVL
jgi:16S rRNA G527 N7-methylase RsmG